MSGHSKWATIHRAKEVNDAKKGAIFTKLGQAITLAAKQGRGLEEAIERARAANMPKENIQRAVDRGMGAGDADNLTEVMYEAFGPGGVAILVSAVTDNKLRTAQKVREVVDKNGGTMGNSGSVSYLFANKGEIVAQSSLPADEAELAIIDLGVDDVEKTDDGFVIYSDRDKMMGIKDELTKLGFKVTSAELVMKPTVNMEVVDAEIRQRIESVLEKLEDLDDIQAVFSNYA